MFAYSKTFLADPHLRTTSLALLWLIFPIVPLNNLAHDATAYDLLLELRADNDSYLFFDAWVLALGLRPAPQGLPVCRGTAALRLIIVQGTVDECHVPESGPS